MLKFGRNYRLKFRIGERQASQASQPASVNFKEEIVVEYPLTLNFNITRAPWVVANSAFFQILNLNEDTRSKLYKDRYDMTKYILVEFYAGYGSDNANLPLVFVGDIFECFSYKEGAGTEYRTEISCITGSFSRKYLYSNVSFAAETKPLEIIKKLCEDAGLELAYYSPEIVNSIPPLIKQQNFTGNSLACLRNFVGGENDITNNVIVDNNKVLIMGTQDVRRGDLIIFNADGGLLGYPKRRNETLTFDILFEPQLQQYQAIQVESQLTDFFNGLYKVIGFSHIGKISGAVGGSVVTKALLYVGGMSFNYATPVLQVK